MEDRHTERGMEGTRGSRSCNERIIIMSMAVMRIAMSMMMTKMILMMIMVIKKRW